MLTQPNVQRYAVESGLRDIMIAQKEVVLTYFSSTVVSWRWAHEKVGSDSITARNLLAASS